jgi:hypothetical protein
VLATAHAPETYLKRLFVANLILEIEAKHWSCFIMNAEE